MARASGEDPNLPIPSWAIDEAERPDAKARVDARLGGVLGKLRDTNLIARVKELYGYVTDPRVPAKYKVIVLAGLVYLVNPFDVIPDAIPGAGFIDDAAVVFAILEAVRRIIGSVEDSAKRVVTHAVAETEEAFARRGVQQVGLSLWAVTLASCVGLVFAAARDALIPGGHGLGDPFVFAAMVVGLVGFATSAALARRVWRTYRSAPPMVRDPLAYAILSVMGVRQIVLLTLPVVVLLLLVGIKLGIAARG
ncbi:MAG TPA: DUF1232 domain-containing protein [Candidatus Eisenbacteria bacterium]|nr:DUF1232 domain-containing protein [Candidatus Eisenbacteria bacterium]